MDVAGGEGPYLMLGCLFVMCAAIGLFISNTATAVPVSYTHLDVYKRQT